MRIHWLVGILTTISLTPAFGGDGSPAPNSINISVATINQWVPEVSLTPQDSFPYAKLVLPTCVGNIKNDCIVSLQYTDNKGAWQNAVFVDPIPLKNLKKLSANFSDDFNENAGNLLLIQN